LEANFLQKPYSLKQLAAKIRVALENKAAAALASAMAGGKP
jgi:DNA-binding response OmpR family regulator